MANSFSFNSIDMSTYGLTVRTHNLDDFSRETAVYQLKSKAVVGASVRPAKEITLDVVIAAADYATLCTYLDSIRAAIDTEVDLALKIDSKTDRYWLAHNGVLQETDNTATTWEGTITFTASDPNAFDNTATSSNHTITTDPQTFNEVVAGTAPVWPVYTLTADATLTAATVIITNNNTGETTQWTGDLVNADVLEFDTAAGTVKLNGTEDMLTVPGTPFPRLVAAVTNSITVTGFHGVANVGYSKRYLS
jgi:hypothetical protein